MLNSDFARHQMHPFLSTIRAFRNGAYYGTKIRAPHAFVMTFLFRKGTLQEKLRSIIKLTYTHTRNLAVFVGIYKAILAILRSSHLYLTSTSSSVAGTPPCHWHSFVAGGIGGYAVWADYSSVNYQIVMYLLSRVLIGIVKSAAARGIEPFSSYKFKKVYPVLATTVWAVVMYLFENEPSCLHPSLASSMEFLYHESNEWKNGFSDFLPSAATSVICAATWLKF